MSINLIKKYDSVNWDLLILILHKIGFDRQYID